MKTLIWWLGLVLIFLVFPIGVSAASLTLQSNQSNIQFSDEFGADITLSLSAASGSAYYLRGVFYKAGTTDYCGYTWNGSSWFNGPYTTNEGWKNFLPITIQNNSWTGTLKAKLDIDDSGCRDSGTYTFKVERFTQSGSGTFDSQNQLTVTITLPTPTPTPVLTSTPTPTAVAPTPTLTPKPTLVVSKISTPTLGIKSTTPTDASESSFASHSGEILGAGVSSKPTLVAADRTQKTTIDWFPIVTTGSGVLILIYCGILFYQNYQKQRGEENA